MRPLSLALTWARPSSRQSLQTPLGRCVHQATVQGQGHSPSDEYSLERLRIPPAVLSAIRLAFPFIKHPTPTQYRFLDAVLKGQDVLLRDKTGTGKSLAAALALLSKERANPHKRPAVGKVAMPITSLLLVPHRDLAYQYLHWIERIHHHMKPETALPSLVQVLIRDSSATLEEHLAPIQRDPPHILIGTPQAVLDVVQADLHALRLDQLSTVVVDEVDYLVESVPIIPDKYAMMKIERQIKRHPGPTRLLLNHIYAATKFHRKDAWRTPNPTGRDHQRDDNRRGSPQLVMMSATLRNYLRRYLLADSGWFTGESGKFVKITGSASARHPTSLKPTTDNPDDKAIFSIGGTDIQHHVLVYTEEGSVANIEGAANAPENRSATSNHAAEEAGQSEEVTLPPELAQVPAGEQFDEPDGPSPFDPNALEAIATAFALDVPSVALLVLRSDAPVQRAIRELRMMGVNAHALDVVKDENGRAHLMRRDFDSTAENPTLLVSTLASTRGLDLPELSHVFILGVLDDGAVDTYLHIAGRVGRFGRGGKVISVVGLVAYRQANGVLKDEPRIMRIMLKKMGIKPVKLEHFVSGGSQ